VSRRNDLDRDALDRPAGEILRRICLAEIDRARRARRALESGEDPEALHDVRVAVRRLRSTIRAFPHDLESTVGKRLRRRLRELARATNPGRDAEVGAAILAGWKDAAEPVERRASEALGGRLARRRDEIGREIEARLVGELDETLDRLAGKLGVWRIELRLTRDPAPVTTSYRDALEQRVRGHETALAAALAESAESGEPEAAHRARIEAKRLRYLLDPVRAALPAAAAPLDRLRALQDLLGELNDLRVLADELAVDAAGAERWRTTREAGLAAPGPRPAGSREGRRRLARRIATRRRELEARFESEWLEPGAAERTRLVADLDAVRGELSGSAAAAAAS